MGIALLAFAIGVIKAGVVLFTPTVWDVRSFPLPVDAYPYLSYGYRAIAAIFGFDSVAEYRVVFLVSIILCVVAIGYAFRSALPASQRSWPLLVLMSGPTAWVIAGGFGRVDPIVLTGGILLGVLGKKPFWAALCILLASLGNPEQAIIIALTIVVISLDQRYRDRLTGALWALMVSVTYFLGLRVWAWNLDVSARDSVFYEILPRSFQAFFIQWPLILWATYGLAVFVVLGLSIRGRRISVPWIVGAVALPLLPSILTADQSRVTVACASAAVTVALIECTPAVLATLRRLTSKPLAATLGVVLILPAIEIQFLTVRSPWQEGWRFFYFYLLSSTGLGSG